MKSQIMTRTLGKLLGLTTVAMLSACVSVAADVPEACLTFADIEMPGDPTMMLGGNVEESFEHDDLGDIEIPEDFDSNVFFNRAFIRLQPGAVSDFSWLTQVNLTVRDPSGELDAVEILKCDDAACLGSDTIEVGGVADVDVQEYIAQGAIAFDMVVSGSLPADAWTIDVDVCMGGDASFSKGL